MTPLIPIALTIAREFAPRMVRWLTDSDRAGEVAGQVVDAARQITGVTDESVALAKLRANPDLVATLQVRLEELDASIELAYLADRQNARLRDVELHKLGYRNRRADAMVLLDVIGLVACLAVLTFFREEIPGEVVGILATIAGVFGACLRDAHQFEFGSSRGSREKDQLLLNAPPPRG